MSDHKISVVLTQVGVHMGDHAQDVVNAIDVDPKMTIGQLVDAELTKVIGGWGGKDLVRAPDPDRYLVIRLAREAGAEK